MEAWQAETPVRGCREGRSALHRLWCCSQGADEAPDPQVCAQVSRIYHNNLWQMCTSPSTAACRAQLGHSTGRGLRVKTCLLSAPHHTTPVASQAETLSP